MFARLFVVSLAGVLVAGVGCSGEQGTEPQRVSTAPSEDLLISPDTDTGTVVGTTSSRPGQGWPNFYPLHPGNTWRYARTIEIVLPGDITVLEETVSRVMAGEDMIGGRIYSREEEFYSEGGQLVTRYRQDRSGLYFLELPPAVFSLTPGFQSQSGIREAAFSRAAAGVPVDSPLPPPSPSSSSKWRRWRA